MRDRGQVASAAIKKAPLDAAAAFFAMNADTRRAAHAEHAPESPARAAAA
jgi:hypothetical protein